ncbi:MAG: hypothetical protein WAW52_14160 [Methanothrix sp.]
MILWASRDFYAGSWTVCPVGPPPTRGSAPAWGGVAVVGRNPWRWEGRGRAPAGGSPPVPGRPEGLGRRGKGAGFWRCGCGKQEGREAARRAEREYVKAANCYAARIINQEAI